MKIEDADTIVIGGGPAGSSAAIYLARFMIPTTLFDAPDQVHGRTSMATHLENFLGHSESVAGKEFLERVSRQLDLFKIRRKNEKVITVSRESDGYFVVYTDKPADYRAKYLVVAVGIGDNMPKVKGLGPYFDHSIFHCLTCDWYYNRKKKIAVIGNDDRAIDAARVIAAMRRPANLVVIPAEKEQKFSLINLNLAKAEDIKVFTSRLKGLNGENGYLHSVTLEDGSEIDVEVLFTKLGHQRYDYFLDEGGIQVERNEDGFIKVDFRTFETSVPNLFAVGPCNEGSDQVIIAGGEGAMAALEIRDRILTKLGI